MIKKIEFNKSKIIPTGTEQEVAGKDWVAWGNDNLYSSFLVSLYYNSSYQSGIIRNKVNYIVGSGFEYNKSAQEFVDNGTHDKDLNDLVNETAIDFELFNGFCLKVVRNNEGGLAHLDVMPMEKMRTNEDMSVFYFSDNWKERTQSTEKTNFRQYPKFNPLSDAPISVFYYREPSKNFDIPKNGKVFNVYPQPIYRGGIQDIMTTIEASKFHYYEIVNSFKAGAIITFTNGEPEPTERATIEDDFKEMVSLENTGGIYLNFVDGQDQLPSIQQLTGNDLDKRYTIVEQESKKNIFVAHAITTPALFGMATQGQLGQQQELETGFEIFKKTYVRSRQNPIEQVYNYIAESFDYDLDMKLNEPESPFSPQLENKTTVADNLNKMSPLLANNVLSTLTINETRALAGLKPIEGGDQIKERTEPNPELFSQDNFFAMAEKLGRKELPKGQVIFECSGKQMFEMKPAKFNILDIDMRFLQTYLKTPNIKTVSESLGLSYTETLNSYARLKANGYLLDGKITLKGFEFINSIQTEFPMEQFFKYILRPDAPDLVEGGKSRDFCQAMMSIDKWYTRDEIEQLNAYTPLGNVFEFRGGWYHNPETNLTTKGCRHDFLGRAIIL